MTVGEQQIMLSPSQAVLILSLWSELKEGSISFRAKEKDAHEGAMKAVKDAAEEIALQIVGY